MCNPYSLNKNRDILARFFRVSHNRTVSFEPSGEYFRGTLRPWCAVRPTASARSF